MSVAVNATCLRPPPETNVARAMCLHPGRQGMETRAILADRNQLTDAYSGLPLKTPLIISHFTKKYRSSE